MKSKNSGIYPVAAFVIVGCVVALPTFAADCPELVGRWPYGPTIAVAVAEPYVYFGSGPSLMVADMSLPSAPRVVGAVALLDKIEDVVVLGEFAFVANREHGLRIIDISGPENPFETGALDTPGDGSGVAVLGNIAYVTDYSHGLRVIDVSVPSHPVEVGIS